MKWNRWLTVAALVAGMAVNAVVLPKGAYAEWRLDKAWQRASETKTEVCINGLWQFRSENRLKLEQEEKSCYLDPVEKSGLKEFQLTSTKDVQVEGEFDTTEKTSGEGSYRVNLTAGTACNTYHVHYYLKGLPTGRKLTFLVDYKSEIEGGSLKIEFQDLRGWEHFSTTSASFDNKAGWKTMSVDMTLPDDCNSLKVILTRSMSGGLKGNVWFDNIRVVERTPKEIVGIDMPTDSAWGYNSVPGSWLGGTMLYWHENDPYKNRGKDLRFGWFRREIEIPAVWEGQRFSLHFDRLATNAIVYCNRQQVGKCDYLGGDVDITDAVKAGAVNEIAVLVASQDRWDLVPGFVARPSSVWSIMPACCGIAGDVYLRVENPSPVSLGRMKLVTAVAGGKKLTVNAPLSESLKSEAAWRCDILRDGSVVKSFEGTASAGAKALEGTFDWPEAELWEPSSPILYEATVSLLSDGKVIEQTLPQRFGFRDFVIRDKYFYLNGIKFNLNPCSFYGGDSWGSKPAIRHWLKNIRNAGYNFVYMEDNHRPGSYDWTTPLLDLCDEMGILAAITPLSLSGGWKLYPMATPHALWHGIVERIVNDNINHPSLVMWRMNMNMDCYNQDQNPLVLDGKMDFAPKSVSAQKAQIMLASNAEVRQLDPSRPNYNHACGKTGEIYTLNNYLGWPELQDLREWLKYWAQGADKPLFMVEHAIPYPGDFQMRDPTRWWENEPVMTEYGAILLGERAYDLEEDDYVEWVKACYKGNGTWGTSYGYNCGLYPKILDECTCITYGVMYPYWRTWGISGGMNAWENTWRRPVKRSGTFWRKYPSVVENEVDWERLQRPGRDTTGWSYTSGGGGEIRTFFDDDNIANLDMLEPTHRAFEFKYLMKRMFAYIGGPLDSWYSVEHAYYSGEKVEKTVILLNDSRSEKEFKVQWQVCIGGQTIASGNGVQKVQPGENGKLPFSFVVPEVAGKSQAEIKASVSCDGEDIVVRSFALQFFPKPVYDNKKLVEISDWALYDPNGKTAPVLAKFGMKVPAISADAPVASQVKVLVIGSNALEKIAGTPLFASLNKAIENGLQVLVCEQTEKALTDVYGFRAFTPGIRTLWIRDKFNPMLAGLNDADFRDWRGTTTQGALEGLPDNLNTGRRWDRVWRCSQMGVVASTVVEKPHTLAFRPLLDTGFDLRYTALFEVPMGRGRMIFSQLDLADRVGTDPAATVVAGNILSVLMKPYSPKEAKVKILRRGCREWLATNCAELWDWLAEGGSIVAYGLTEDEGRLLSTVSGNLFTVGKGVNWLNPLKGWLPPEFAGISVADIRWRKKLSSAVLSSVAGNAWKSESGVIGCIRCGTGRIVWLSADASDFPVSERTDLVFSRVKTERLLQIVLANLGESAKWDKLYTDERVPRDDPYANMRW